jgi:hypothetical protein
MKNARILDDDNGGFRLEYDNTLGKTNTMRLDAVNYESAIREAKAFLGIHSDDHDAEGSQWNVE